MTRNLWLLAAASYGVTGPIGAIAVAIAALGVAIYDLSRENSVIYNWLTKLFPEGMRKLEDEIHYTVEAVKAAVTNVKNFIVQTFESMFSWLDSKIAAIAGSVSGMIPNWMSFGGANPRPRYSAPQTPYGSILGTTPKGIGSIPLSLPQPNAPAATKQDLIEYLKPQSSNNTYNINVNAPGANGDDIAERIRRAFETKPLFDSDGALAPG